MIDDTTSKQDPLDAEQTLAIRDQVDGKLASYAKIFGIANIAVLVAGAAALYVQFEGWQYQAIEDVKRDTTKAATDDAKLQLEKLFSEYEDQVTSIEKNLDEVDAKSNKAESRADTLIGRLIENERTVSGAQDRYDKLISNLGVLSDENKIDSARTIVETLHSNQKLQTMFKNSVDNKRSLESLKPLIGARTYMSRQNADMSATGRKWVDIPGTELNFQLEQKRSVNLHGTGSVHGAKSLEGNGARTHCGFRFVVNDQTTGHVNWGDQIVGCGVPDMAKNDSGWWCPWGIRRMVDLEKGKHSVKLQITGWINSESKGAKCELHENDYSAAKLFVDIQ